MFKFPTKENNYKFEMGLNQRIGDSGAASLVPNATLFIYAPAHNTTIIYNSKTITQAYEGKYRK
ncbi:hypothetical protein [Apibacter sp. HY039]|uniref:hypothetical protein n=1 Tax=Apibacter sp. HY039 TaxID=2501476 RepID=UPI000FEBEF90|nr:hypothetical protein [Apibacter sp. HY039]